MKVILLFSLALMSLKSSLENDPEVVELIIYQKHRLNDVDRIQGAYDVRIYKGEELIAENFFDRFYPFVSDTMRLDPGEYEIHYNNIFHEPVVKEISFAKGGVYIDSLMADYIGSAEKYKRNYTDVPLITLEYNSIVTKATSA